LGLTPDYIPSPLPPPYSLDDAGNEKPSPFIF
jgi:hypothetical protein